MDLMSRCGFRGRRWKGLWIARGFCPSSVNKQPLKYFLTWEPEEVEKVQGLTKWARALPDMVLPHPGKRPTGFVVICQDKRIDEI